MVFIITIGMVHNVYRVAKNVLPGGTAPMANAINIEFYTK
jgi:hypothetical protein